MNMILGIIVVLVIGIAIMYNGLINKKNQVENAFGGMDAQLKKRYDLIPNLISTVKTYMKHEADTLTQITELRAKAVSGEISDDEKVDLDNTITSKLGGIMVAVENYPDLKASDNFNQFLSLRTRNSRRWTRCQRRSVSRASALRFSASCDTR